MFRRQLSDRSEIGLMDQAMGDIAAWNAGETAFVNDVHQWPAPLGSHGAAKSVFDRGSQPVRTGGRHSASQAHPGGSSR